MNKKLFSGKKAQGGLDLSSDTVIRVVLSVGAILLLTIFIVKIWNVFVPDTEKATIRNFEQLVASIKNMDEGASFSSYPLFVDKNYAIVGYQSGIRSIGGTCTAYAITSPYSNTKPEQCGIGEEGCLCLCKNTKDFATLCRENDQVEQCATVETFGKDYSFTGGTYTDGGSCSFALVLGAESVQSVYLKKTEDTVRICTKECNDASDLTPASATEESSVSTESSSASAETSGQSVLIIGDSQTMGTYGDTLYALFKDDGYTTNKYAVCGSTPSYFTEGISIISSACNAEYMYDDGSAESVTSGDTPLLTELIEKHNPDTVFVTFASNMYGSSEKTIQNAVETFGEEITSQGIACYWAGPPQGPRYSDLEDYQQFKDTIKESAESSGCTFIDSEDYTAFAFCGDTAFGCDADVHFDNHGSAGKAAAEAWAEGVYSEFSGTLVS